MRYVLQQIYGITPNRSKEYKLYSAWYRNALAYLSKVVEDYSILAQGMDQYQAIEMLTRLGYSISLTQR